MQGLHKLKVPDRGRGAGFPMEHGGREKRPVGIQLMQQGRMEIRNLVSLFIEAGEAGAFQAFRLLPLERIRSGCSWTDPPFVFQHDFQGAGEKSICCAGVIRSRREGSPPPARSKMTCRPRLTIRQLHRI